MAGWCSRSKYKGDDLDSRQMEVLNALRNAMLAQVGLEDDDPPSLTEGDANRAGGMHLSLFIINFLILQ